MADATDRGRSGLDRLLTAFRVCLVATTLMAVGCGGGSTPTSPDEDPNPGQGECGPYPDWKTSEYNLPWAIGQTFVVLQGNCSEGTHTTKNRFRYSYDITMPVGTVFTAAREGEVIQVSVGGVNYGDRTNNIEILHPDGTVGRYNHLTRRGTLVRQFDRVAQGDPIGMSGCSGCRLTVKPHLHFHVEITKGGESIAVTFKNTSPNPNGLLRRMAYTALPPGAQQGASHRLDAVATSPGNTPEPDQALPKPSGGRPFELNPD